MAKKIVEYEINNDGDCNNCNSCTVICGINYCNAFNDVMFYVGSRGNLPACKDFLAAEASKQKEQV
jgi:hypothetical protein